MNYDRSSSPSNKMERLDTEKNLISPRINDPKHPGEFTKQLGKSTFKSNISYKFLLQSCWTLILILQQSSSL